MAVTIQLAQEACFDPEVTHLLGAAYESACKGIGPDPTAREALAKRIMEAAKCGERDLERLIKYGIETT